MSNISIHPLGLRGKGWTPIEEEQLVHLYKLNYSYEEISKILGRSISSVHGKICLIRKMSGLNWNKKDFKAVNSAKRISGKVPSEVSVDIVCINNL